MISKKDKSDKYKLIMHLSVPAVCSVNNGIPKDDSSFHYTSVEAVKARTVKLSAGCLLAKWTSSKPTETSWWHLLTDDH